MFNDGMRQYSQMQKEIYNEQSKNFHFARDTCVGNFKTHEAYPYKEYLLEKYQGGYGRCLDFGCGIGRLIKTMLTSFDKVVGVDIATNNLKHAETYLTENGIEREKYDVFLVDGMSCNIDIDYKFDFAYSTLCLQHICVHETRQNIVKDICSLLKDDGQACFQMGTGGVWNDGALWMDNNYDAGGTNGSEDVFIPDESYFPVIEQDFNNAGYKDVIFEIKESPHPKLNDYHTNWLFIHCKKQNG